MRSEAEIRLHRVEREIDDLRVLIWFSLSVEAIGLILTITILFILLVGG